MFCTQSQWDFWSKFSNTNLMKTWVSTKLKFRVDWNNKKMFQKCQMECSSRKEYLGYPLYISPISHQAPKIYTLLNWTVSTIEDEMLFFTSSDEILCNSHHPMWTLHNPSIVGQWVNNMAIFWLFQQLPCPKCNNFHKNAICWKVQYNFHNFL